MTKKTLILLLGLSLCLTNGFADEVPELIFEFPTAEGDEYIQGTEDIIRRAPDSIFGEPDFEKMRDLPPNSQDYQLGRKVAFLFTAIEPGSPRGFICTGFLVGPDLLMTNHHCTHDAFGRPAPLELMAIYMDYYQEPDVDPTRGGVTAGVTAIVSADAPLDYALLRLDKPIGNTYGWLELDTTTQVDSSQSVKLISHNGGRSKEIVRRNSQIVDIPADHPLANVPFALAYLADTEGGSSGSPIFLRDGTGVIGINHSSWFNRDGPTFNAGSLMSYIVPEIEQWLPRGAAPDLVVESARVDKEFLRPGESFTLSLTVRNQGTAASPTTLRYYRSTDDTISIDDAPVGTDTVGSLAMGGTVEKSITLTAPNYVGTYHYGACVDPVTNETATYNNCSPAVRIGISNTPLFWIYWTQGERSIQRAVNDGTNRQFLVNIQTSDQSGGIALDVEGGKMYWTLWIGSKIQRANLDGSNLEDVVTGLPEPMAIALDTAGEKMYWTNTWRSSIQRANLDGSNVEVLVSGLNTPLGIALDITGRKVYWTNWGPDLIQRSNLDGSNVEDLVSGLDHPVGIALDVANGKVYWVDTGSDNADDTGNGKVQRSNLDGSNVEDLVSGLDHPFGIALDVAEQKMYWTDRSAGLIQRSNLDGSHVEDLIASPAPYYLALGISQPSGPSPPTAPISFRPSTIADQTFTVGSTIQPLRLPVAEGGTPPYTYSLTPIPAGLSFDTATRLLSGTPSTVVVTRVTYTATDATDASASLTFTIEVIEDNPGPGPLDVNGDGQVTAIDLVAVALFYGTQVPAGISLPADVNADGIVNILDLTLVAQGIDAVRDSIHELSLEEFEAALLAAVEQTADVEEIAEAPIGFGTSQHVPFVVYRNVAAALADAKHLATSDVRFEKGVPAVLEVLLHLLAEMGTIPEAMALLPNYPNPFNPETWIPYHLAKDAEVTLTIYDVRGSVVRTLTLGHQPAGIYQSKHRAAYWDGRNESGEPVASGVYFYTLTAGEFTATRKLLIVK